MNAPEPHDRNAHSRVEHLLARLPEPARPHVRESIARLASVRTPGQAMQAFSDEVEHLLRVLTPVFVSYPLVRTPAAARHLAAMSAATAATIEQADELLAVVSFGGTVAPGTITVVTVGVVATMVEAFAATSVRVHQLRFHGIELDAGVIASDVHAALFDDRSPLRRRVSPDALARKGAARLARRWTAGLVPVVGIAYAGYDARRTVDRVLLRPLPGSA